MSLDSLLAAAHLLGLAIGIPAIRARASALRGPLDSAGLARVFAADNAWALAAGIWIATGLVRLFGPFAKGTAYYMTNHLFFAKMGCLALILLLEVAPIIALVRWRIAVKKNAAPDTGAARTFAVTSDVQLVLVLVMLVLATGMARGLGVVSTPATH